MLPKTGKNTVLIWEDQEINVDRDVGRELWQVEVWQLHLFINQELG